MKRITLNAEGNTRYDVARELRVIADRLESESIEFVFQYTDDGGYNFFIEDVEYWKPEIKVDPDWQDEYDHTQNYEEVFG